MANFTLAQTVSAPGLSVSVSKSYSEDLLETLIGVANSNATTQFMIPLDVSAIVGIMIYSDVQVTLKTNSTGSPANTIVIKADVPYIWNSDSYASLLLTTDVTSMYFVNATSNDANIKVMAVLAP